VFAGTRLISGSSRWAGLRDEDIDRICAFTQTVKPVTRLPECSACPP